MPVLQVLLVEDQDSNIDSWMDRAEFYNADADKRGFSVATLTAKSVFEAKSCLANNKIDAVVVDLRLQPNAQDQPNDHGNSLVRYAYQTHPVAIAIYTGQGQEAETEQYPQVEVFDRGDGVDQVFEWLDRQRPMLMKLQSTREAIERETARVFFKAIWPRWTHWAANDPDIFSPMLARHVVAHIHDALLDADGGCAHPEETYFLPPIKDRLDTGDLIKKADGLWIVVTPRCDLASPNKVTSVLVAKCLDISDRWRAAKPKEKNKVAQHDGSAKLHFLPQLLDAAGLPLGPWFAQFNELKAIPIAEVPTELSNHRWASLTPQFVPSLVERFGAYFGRIGTPNFSSE